MTSCDPRVCARGKKAANVHVSFEDYGLDVERRELTHRAEPVSVGPQVFDLLVYLVRNREHVVSKDDLIEVRLGRTDHL